MKCKGGNWLYIQCQLYWENYQQKLFLICYLQCLGVAPWLRLQPYTHLRVIPIEHNGAYIQIDMDRLGLSVQFSLQFLWSTSAFFVPIYSGIFLPCLPNYKQLWGHSESPPETVLHHGTDLKSSTMWEPVKTNRRHTFFQRCLVQTCDICTCQFVRQKNHNTKFVFV